MNKLYGRDQEARRLQKTRPFYSAYYSPLLQSKNVLLFEHFFLKYVIIDNKKQ